MSSYTVRHLCIGQVMITKHLPFDFPEINWHLQGCTFPKRKQSSSNLNFPGAMLVQEGQWQIQIWKKNLYNSAILGGFEPPKRKLFSHETKVKSCRFAGIWHEYQGNIHWFDPFFRDCHEFWEEHRNVLWPQSVGIVPSWHGQLAEPGPQWRYHLSPRGGTKI